MKKRRFKKRGKFFVYILLCADGTYYTGYTNSLERRISQHNTGKGGAKYTKWKKGGVLAWSKEYCYFKPAFLMEKRIKTLTRKQKESLVKGMRLNDVLKKADK